MASTLVLENGNQILTPRIRDYFSLQETNPQMFDFLSIMNEEELDEQLAYAQGIEELFPVSLPITGLKIKNKKTFDSIRRFDDWLNHLVHIWVCVHRCQSREIGIVDPPFDTIDIVRSLSAIKSLYDGYIVQYNPSFHMDLGETADLLYISTEIARDIIKEEYDKLYTKRQGKKINSRIFKRCLRRLKSTSQQHAINYAWKELNLLAS